MGAATTVGRRRRVTWLLWLILTSVTALSLARRMTHPKASKEVFLPGKTSHGHYQIELECGACHKKEFADRADFQVACVECHAKELEVAQDSHPESKFTDPRNAERVAQLDARYCVTCHSEHQPERTATMGLSLPEDYCFHCHEDVAEERSSHQGLPFDSCASSGCHNFHDNRALYEDYLVRHADEGMMASHPARLLADGPKACPAPERAGLDHETPVESCRDCHQAETTTWLEGRHGMRMSRGLPPLRVKDARLPMKDNPHSSTMTCAACHSGARPEEIVGIEVDVCLGCHDDKHSGAYRKSKHYAVLLAEQAGRVAKGSGASCVTCHMPRFKDEDGKVSVNHNQNDNLRPNEKMIRSVCMDCHGLPFSIDALADRNLIDSNFWGMPRRHVLSVEYAVSRE